MYWYRFLLVMRSSPLPEKKHPPSSVNSAGLLKFFSAGSGIVDQVARDVQKKHLGTKYKMSKTSTDGVLIKCTHGNATRNLPAKANDVKSAAVHTLWLRDCTSSASLIWRSNLLTDQSSSRVDNQNFQ